MPADPLDEIDQLPLGGSAALEVFRHVVLDVLRAQRREITWLKEEKAQLESQVADLRYDLGRLSRR